MASAKLDLVLINPGNKRQMYQQLGASLAASEPPIWAGLIASFVRGRSLSVRIIDANVEGLSGQETAERVKEMKPGLAVVVVYGQNPSASTMVMPAAGAACTAIKETCPDLPLLMVGGHVASLPERTLREEAVDFVCTGEGPYTVAELAEAIKANAKSYKDVRGLAYIQGDVVVQTPAAPLVTDLTEMPGLAWDLLPMERYVAHNWHCFQSVDQRQPYASLYTSLGCPFHCEFCCIQAPFRSGERLMGLSENVSSYRMWSPEAVLSQLDVLVNKYGVKNVKFADELFVLNKNHVLGICDGIIERGYDLNIWAYARVDSWTVEMLDRMKQAGINWLCPGIESGSTRVRNDVNKGYKQEDAISAVAAFKKAGIYVIGNFLFGLPEDDLESMRETLDLAKELNCEFANFYCAMAYPGSKLYEHAKREKLPLPDSWSGYSQHAYDTLPLPTKYLRGEEVLRFRDAAFTEYFMNPRYLSMIESTFGTQVADHIREMASQKLSRKFG